MKKKNFDKINKIFGKKKYDGKKIKWGKKTFEKKNINDFFFKFEILKFKI